MVSFFFPLCFLFFFCKKSRVIETGGFIFLTAAGTHTHMMCYEEGGQQGAEPVFIASGEHESDVNPP